MIFVLVSPAFTQTVTNVDGIRYLIEGNSAKAIDVEKDNIRYHLYETTKSAEVLNVDSKSVNVVIPETIEHEGVIYTVTRIGALAFAYCTRLKSVIIEEGVKHIGVRAFRNCTSLKSIVIPNSVTDIEEGCFYECSKLSSVTLGDSIVSIPKGCFSQCKDLKIVKRGKNVKDIGEYAFSFCEVIEEIHINAENPPQIAEYSLGTLSYTTLYVPNEFLENYKAIAPWRYAKKFVSADK